MARQLDLTPLRENGPIEHFPNWQAALAPRCLPKEVDLEADKSANPQSAIRNPQSEIPPRPGRPRALDERKQATICNLIAAGVSLSQAAQFVECDPRSIQREARRNAEFRRQLAKARSEASIHPLQTLRQAAKSNWRAALCWMERLDPARFARPDASVVTKRESNQFVADLVESIERAVPDSQDRANLYELLSAAMPAAMRRRWDGHGSRRSLKQAMRDFDEKRLEELERRAKRRREFTDRIARYLPWQLIGELSDYNDVLDPDVIAADRAHAAARQSGPPHRPQNDADAENDGPLNDGPLNESVLNDGPPSDDLPNDDLPNDDLPNDDLPNDDLPNDDLPNDDLPSDGPPNDGPPNDDTTNSAPDGLPNLGRTNFAAPRGVFVAPPRRNSDNFASPADPNRQLANDLRQPGEAKFAE